MMTATPEHYLMMLGKFKKGVDTTAGEAFNLGVFVDAEYIADWAWSAMSWAAGTGLMGSVGNERISPESEATRAQVATILMRFCTKIAE